MLSAGVSLALPETASTSMESLVLTRLMAALSGLPGPTCQRFDPHPIFSNIILMHTEVRQSVRLPTPSKTTNHLTSILTYSKLSGSYSCHNSCRHGAAGFISFGCTLAPNDETWQILTMPTALAPQGPARSRPSFTASKKPLLSPRSKRSMSICGQ